MSEMTIKYYPINEIFYSVQGEGANTGRAAVFVRFSGCNLACPFCDTSFDKHRLYSGRALTDEITELIKQTGCKLLVFTGGEPTLFLDDTLIQAVKKENPELELAIESNGTHKIPSGIDFVTISPKEDFLHDKKAVDKAKCKVGECAELKVVYNGENNPLAWENRIKAKYYFIQPCDTKDEKRNQEILAETVEFVKRNPNWRISLQTQKILQVR